MATVGNELIPPQICNRPEQPFVNQLDPAYVNPYESGELLHPAPDPKYTRFWYCGQLWSNSLSTWLATAPITYGPVRAAQTISDTGIQVTAVETWDIPANPVVTGTGVITFDTGDVVTIDDVILKAAVATTITETDTIGWEGPITWAALTSAFYASNFTWYPLTTACCGLCSMTGGDVKVYHWPTPAPSPPTSILVNAEGFTL